MVRIALATIIALAASATAWPNLAHRQDGNDLVSRGAGASQSNADNGVNNLGGVNGAAGGATRNGQTKTQKQRNQQTQTGGAQRGGAQTGANTPDDGRGSKNKGHGQGKQFITGLCAPRADCASQCCAKDGCKVVCKAPGALGNVPGDRRDLQCHILRDQARSETTMIRGNKSRIDI